MSREWEGEEAYIGLFLSVVGLSAGWVVTVSTSQKRQRVGRVELDKSIASGIG